MGVSYDSFNKQWRSKIHVDGKTIHLGRFVKLSDAKKARLDADKCYGFHPNHGGKADG